MTNVASIVAASAVMSRPTATLQSRATSMSVFGGPTWGTKSLLSRSTMRVHASAVDVSKIVPQADRILIRLDPLAEQSSGGVLLPRSAVKYERYLVGEVLAIGSQVEKIEKGNRVLVSDMNAYEVNLGTQEKLCFAKSADLLAVVEEK